MAFGSCGISVSAVRLDGGSGETAAPGTPVLASLHPNILGLTRVNDWQVARERLENDISQANEERIDYYLHASQATIRVVLYPQLILYQYDTKDGFFAPTIRHTLTYWVKGASPVELAFPAAPGRCYHLGYQWDPPPPRDASHTLPPGGRVRVFVLQQNIEADPAWRPDALQAIVDAGSDPRVVASAEIAYVCSRVKPGFDWMQDR